MPNIQFWMSLMCQTFPLITRWEFLHLLNSPTWTSLPLRSKKRHSPYPLRAMTFLLWIQMSSLEASPHSPSCRWGIWKIWNAWMLMMTTLVLKKLLTRQV
ncbi:hypothetical protein EFK68_04360 [Pseudomonas aeruginosa]|nr:hypothetical protein EFK68_04360 [Pseudomonas aeruginosa]